MGDKFANFLKKPEVEQTLLSQQKEMLGTSSTSDDDDEYKDFLCEDKTNFSSNNRVKEINIQKRLEMDNKEMLDESFGSHDEDFRVKDSTPPKLNVNQSDILPDGSGSVSTKTRPSLSEMFVKHVTMSSDDDDYICISSPPKSIEVPSFESKDDLQSNSRSYSSQDEDFRLQNPSPSSLSKDEEFLRSPNSFGLNDVEKNDIIHNDTPEKSTDLEPPERENRSINSITGDLEINSYISDEQEFFSQNSSFQEDDGSEQNFLMNVSHNEKSESIIEDGDELVNNQILDMGNSVTQQDVHKDIINQKDFGNASGFKQLLTRMPESLLSKIFQTYDPKSASHSSSFIGDLTNKYSRDDLLQIRRLKTVEEWKSFLWTNHGASWPIDEMPFEMDPDLRCPFHERINILRERQEAARLFFVSSRPQTDLPPTGDLTTDRRYRKSDYNRCNYQNKNNEQRKSKQKNKKNKKVKNSGGVVLQLKSVNKENTQMDQLKQNNKVDWTDSEECDESSGNEGLKKKTIDISSAPSESKCAIRYLESVTSLEDVREQKKEQNSFLDSEKEEWIDKIANRQSLVGFPYWHKYSDHPDWQRSTNVLEFYFNQVNKDILEVNEE